MREPYGLVSSTSEAVPLLGVNVEGDILGRGARVKVSQRFSNREDRAIEAVYKFPLPEGAAVCGFKAIIDGKEIRGLVEEREKAFEIYDDSLARGDGGYLLDEELPNIFTLSVGNLNPYSEVVIEIEYVTLLDMEGPKIRFSLPTTISPRYLPEDMKEDDGIPADSKLHPPYAASVPYGLSICLRIHNGLPLEGVASPSHQIGIENIKGDPITITLSAESTRMDRDFVLYLKHREALESRAYRYCSAGEVFLQLDFCLDKDEEGSTHEEHTNSQGNREIIFVVDCSGSMTGDSLQEAKKALEICLRGLEEGTSFNIYRFGSEFDRLFSFSKEYSEKSLKMALKYLQNMDADLGGTEILSPLKEIYSADAQNRKGKRSILLITDGEVGNEDEIIETARKNRGSTRLFSIGIGAGCNEYFIKGIARAGRGASDFIYPGERIEPKVLEVFGKTQQEGLAHPVIQWGNVSLEQAPAEPAIFFESPVTVFARGNAGELLDDKILVKGELNGQKRVWEIDIVDSDQAGLPLSALWARERIRDLEESGSAICGAGSRQTDRKAERLKDTVIQLSKQYGIFSRATSYVAIEEREEKDKTTGELVLRKIPVPLTIGWHGTGSVFGVGEVTVRYAAGPTQTSYSQSVPWWSDKLFEKDKSYTVRHSVAPAPDGKRDLMLSILASQETLGGMEINEEIAIGISIEVDRIRKMAEEIEVTVPVDRFLLLSTAILLKVLELHFAQDMKSWKKVVKKSRRWMKNILAKGKPRISGEDLMTWVENFVRCEIEI